jgi:UDP-glucose 4-epimerase
MDDLTWTGKRVLVTGGQGYLGKRLADALGSKGAEVHAVDIRGRGEEREIVADITDPGSLHDKLKDLHPEVVFHLAASLNRDRDFVVHDPVMKVNYYGTLHLLQALKEVPYENFVFTSTSEIYGSNTPPFQEDQLPAPASPYSLSKICSEQLVQTFSRTYQKNHTILRLFNFFGKDMPEAFFIPQLIRSLRSDPVFKMTEGEQARDFLHVDDVIRALLLAGSKSEARGQIFNVCSGESVTLRELVLLFQEKIASTCPIEFGALPYRENEIWNMVGNPDRIRKMLGFTPELTLEQAIEKTLN